tara:strand:- start:432 stop:587 length:156 start_codon:yes stop_codon:yes gene_type:complete
MKLYMIKVPVAFFVEAEEQHVDTVAFSIIENMAAYSDEVVHFGKTEIVAVF